jgi:predicted nucleotidyltransferase
MEMEHLAPEVAEVVRRVVASAAPEMIILFGSRARGDATSDSDVDLLVVADVPPRDRRALSVAIERALLGISLPTDVIVLSRADLETQQDVVGTVAHPAVREGYVLYARAA